jgi:16S rRNA G1207 methylase RsmC
MNNTNPFFKQNLSYKHGKINLNFKVSQDLFSSAFIDHGTQRLLRTLLFEKIDTFHKALDMGCGYGPIGIALKAGCPSAEVHMTDRDALALEYSRENASLNGFDDLKIYGSLAYDSIKDTDFDLIVSNIPAKVGEPILKNMIIDAQDHLIDGGKVVIVVIDAINDFINQELTQDENIDITFHRSWPGHHVYHYQFKTKRKIPNINTFNSGDYYRQKNLVKINNQEFELDVSHNLPEFDQLSFDTSLLLQYIEQLKIKPNAEVLNINPGQGYIPLAIARNTKNVSLLIPDRDLLALKTTDHNLDKFKVQHETFHQVGFALREKQLDAAIGIFPEKQNVEVYELYVQQITIHLKQNAPFVICSSSTVITRIEDLIHQRKSFEIVRRNRDNGRSVIEMRKN